MTKQQKRKLAMRKAQAEYRKKGKLARQILQGLIGLWERNKLAGTTSEFYRLMEASKEVL